jgi:hypothetical protein
MRVWPKRTLLQRDARKSIIMAEILAADWQQNGSLKPQLCSGVIRFERLFLFHLPSLCRLAAPTRVIRSARWVKGNTKTARTLLICPSLAHQGDAATLTFTATFFEYTKRTKGGQLSDIAPFHSFEFQKRAS